MVRTFTKKVIILCMCVAIFLSSLGFLISVLASDVMVSSPYSITIVLDAGHGGIDGGSVGTSTKITESELNLIYVNKLEKLLKSVGINVVKTRQNMDGLYDSNSTSLKKDDMQKRKQIISSSNAQAVVSIHMNKFSLQSEKGAQVFYQENNQKGKIFAETIKECLVKQIENARNLTLGGDYFICKCSDAPSIIVECGFLSNPQEEVLLQNGEYQDKFCYAVFCGIVKYFNIVTSGV